MNPPCLDLSNINALWGSVIAEVLVRCGVRFVAISPGSRSTPLAFAFARHPGLEAIPILDERSASFYALGLAKRDLAPVVLLCTSGSAGAHYFPALIEAHEAGVPLIVITADRPPEMRSCASGQTIDQHRLFGLYASYYHELALPEASLPLIRYLRQSMAHAVERALAPVRGPVHLNAPFRDPLVPTGDGGKTEAFAAQIDWSTFFDHLSPPPPIVCSLSVPGIDRQARGVIITGPVLTADPAGFAASVGEISRRLGWPVLADGLSPVRNHAVTPHVVTRYDAILRSTAAGQALRPEQVLCLGEWPTSKVLRAWVESSDCPITLLTERTDNRDSLHGATRRIVGSVAALACALPEAEMPNSYQRLWASYEARARAYLDARLDSESALIEPKAAWLLGRKLPKMTSVSVSNSMPVRDVEFVWPANDRGYRLFFNRGANGIDGTVSTALGVAHEGAPSVLLTGDLAFLHDSNGLLAAGRHPGSLTVVLINNNGGGIFEHLPVAQFGVVFEEFFATPQGVDFERLCSAHKISHTLVRDWPQFESLISELPAKGLRVLELRTDRKADAEWRKQAFAMAAR